jgi:hypothetical protein
MEKNREFLLYSLKLWLYEKLYLKLSYASSSSSITASNSTLAQFSFKPSSVLRGSGI